MTTIRDMLLRDLRAIGAEGVVEVWRTARTEDIGLGEYWPGPNARPAFRDDDGRLVPLPEGWRVEHRSYAGRMACQFALGQRIELRPVIDLGRPVWLLYTDGDTDDTSYPSAPEAWAAAEARIKEQGR